MDRFVLSLMLLVDACVMVTGAAAQVTMVSQRYAPQCVAELAAAAFALGFLTCALGARQVRGWGWLAAAFTLLLGLLVVSDGVSRLVAIERYSG